MDINVARARVLATLPELDTRGFGLGALPLHYDTRDRSLRSIGEISEVLRQEIPAEADLWDYVQMIYNQGGDESCVAYSTAAMQSIFENVEHGWWFELDADECYHANGGYGPNGVPTRDVLGWEQRVGMRFITTGRRYRIGSYAFADPRTPAGINEIKSAVAAKRPCVLALLLPLDFWDGDSNGAVVTSAYHQLCVTGYTQERFLFVNSWGVDYGHGGFGSIPWAFLRRQEQQHFVYAFTAIDAIDDNLLLVETPEAERRSLRAVKKPDRTE